MSAPKQHASRFDLRALYETSQLLNRSLDTDFILTNLLLSTMSKLLVTRSIALLHVPVEHAFRVAVVKGIPAVAKDARIRMENYPQQMVRNVAIPEALAQHKISLVLPIQFRHRFIGMIGLGKKATGQSYAVEELEFVQSLVNMSASAIHNSLMVEELKLANRDLDGKVQQLHTLFDLSREFNAVVERDRIVRIFTFGLMGQMLVGKYVFFFRHSGSGKQEESLDIVSMQGIRDPHFETEFIDRIRTLDTLVHLEAEVDILPEWEAMRRRNLILAIPLRQQDETNGVLCLSPKLTGQPYLPEDVEFLTSLGTLAVVSIQNVELIEDRIEKRRMDEEMRLARDIQQRLLPHDIPAVSGVQIATLALPSREVGGDYFDVVSLPGNRILLVIADVTGKGVPAALLMSSIQACLHTMVPMDIALEVMVGHINRVISQNTSPDKFITAFCAIYHVETRHLDYVNAGHEPPLVIHPDGEIEELTTGGLLMGVLSSAAYEKGYMQLISGDTMILFTDGVTEAMGVDQKEYTDARLRAKALTSRHLSAQKILNNIQTDVENFTGPVHVRSDDRTMIILKVAAERA